MALPRAWGPTPGHPKGPPVPKVTPLKPPKKPPKPPGAPGAPRVVALTPDQQASASAMSAFRTALEQLKASTPAVDSAAIYAPYRASEQITGQLGQGLQQAELAGGQAAQAQYGQALGQAQQQAASFGISAGAGANPTALQNTGAAPLAQQTNAYAAAAPQAAAQWQALLERSAAAKVAGATTDRQNLIAQGTANLSTALPAAIRDEKQSLFQGRVQNFNEGLARTQLTAKQNADMRDYGLGVAKVQQQGQTAAETARIKREALAEKTSTDAAKLAQGNRKLAQGDQALAIKRRASQANAKGLKGVSAAVKALSGTTTGGSRGWKVQVQPHDADGNALGPVVTKHGPRKDWAPKGYKNVGGSKPDYTDAKNTPKTSGVTASSWDQQMRSLLAQNPGQSAAIKAFLGPRPKK